MPNRRRSRPVWCSRRRPTQHGGPRWERAGRLARPRAIGSSWRSMAGFRRVCLPTPAAGVTPVGLAYCDGTKVGQTVEPASAESSDWAA